jgi:hypothetical protein
MTRNTDLEYKLNYHILKSVKAKYHLKNTKCRTVHLGDLNREIGLGLRLKDEPSCKLVFKTLFAMWIDNKCFELYPEPSWVWELYFDLKDL